jgi:hypothetical protein
MTLSSIYALTSHPFLRLNFTKHCLGLCVNWTTASYPDNSSAHCPNSKPHIINVTTILNSMYANFLPKHPIMLNTNGSAGQAAMS